MDRRGRTPAPLYIAAAACLVLALISLALPSGPTYDPYAWLIWGRDLSDLGLSMTGGGTSWKPLPSLVDALLTPLGRGAAGGWLVFARAGALFAVFMAYRLAARLAPPRRAAVAGTVAAVALVLTHEWVRRNGVGDAEGLMVAFGLLAIDRHVDGRRGQAFALLVAAGLIRVEFWPFVAAYGGWLAWTGGVRTRLAVVCGGLAIPLLWFGGDWIGSGRLTTAAGRALHPVPGSPGVAAHPALAVAGEAFAMLPLPAWLGIAALLAAAMRAPGSRRASAGARAPVAIAVFAAAWTALVAAMAERGYAGLPRFLFMASALEAVTAGVGAAYVADALGRLRRPTAAGLALIAFCAFALGCIPAAARLPTDLAAIDKVADMDGLLARSVGQAGERGEILRCSERARWYTVTALAWDIDVQPGAIHARCPRSAPPRVHLRSAGAGSSRHGRQAART